MLFEKGTPVLDKSHDAFPDTIGIIIDVEQGAAYEYRIVFADDDDDWYTNVNGSVTRMVNDYKAMLNEQEIPTG